MSNRTPTSSQPEACYFGKSMPHWQACGSRGPACRRRRRRAGAGTKFHWHATPSQVAQCHTSLPGLSSLNFKLVLVTQALVTPLSLGVLVSFLPFGTQGFCSNLCPGRDLLLCRLLRPPPASKRAGLRWGCLQLKVRI
jgi:hypothetical protein